MFLGMEFKRDRENKIFFVNQTKNIEQLAEKFRVLDAHPVKIPAQKSSIARIETETKVFENVNLFQQLAGSLLYLERCTRKDISFTTNLICRYMSKPTKVVWEIAKYCLRFLYSTKNQNLILGGKVSSPSRLLTIFADAGWGPNRNGRRSTTGFHIFFNNHCVESNTRLQRTVATSSCESELYAGCDAVKTTIWWVAIINTLGIFPKQEKVPIYIDNKGGRDLMHQAGNFRRTKHIDIRYYFVREKDIQGIIAIRPVKSSDNIADLNTKALDRVLFNRHAAAVMSGLQGVVF